MEMTIIQKEFEDDIEMTIEDLKKVEYLKNNIDIKDSSLTITYGVPAQKQLSDFSDMMIKMIEEKNSDTVEVILSDLINKIKTFNAISNKNSFLRNIPFLNRLATSTKDIISNYKTLLSQIDKLTENLEQSKLTILRNILLFDKFYEKNLKYYKNIQIYIRAGEDKIKEVRSNREDDIREIEERIDKFEKRIYDLKMSKMIAMQTAPQILILQNNDKILIEKIQTAIHQTIPLWKNQILISLGINKQKRILKIQNQIAEMTNDSTLQNIELLKEFKSCNIDIESLKKSNEIFIDTIKETLSFQTENKMKRLQYEEEINRLNEGIR